MDVTTLRIAITVISFITFIGIVIWAYSGSQKSRFDEAANLPFSDDEMQERTIGKNQQASSSPSSKHAESEIEVPHG